MSVWQSARDDAAENQRYQLLHRTVSAILEAERYGAEHALMLVHSLRTADTSFEDYRDFALLLGFAENAIQGQPNCRCTNSLEDVRLHLGWVKRCTRQW